MSTSVDAKGDDMDGGLENVELKVRFAIRLELK
jgi:hypothetical protein